MNTIARDDLCLDVVPQRRRGRRVLQETMKRITTTIFFLFLFITVSGIAPQEAFVSQIHPQSIQLPELVRRSSCILVVREANPSTTSQYIQIHQDRVTYPDFMQTLLHYEIIEVLRGTGDLKAGSAVTVLQAHTDALFATHKMYYLDGVSVSQVLDAYNSRVETSTPATLLLFLRKRIDGQYELTVFHAYESITKKGEIQELLRNPTNSP